MSQAREYENFTGGARGFARGAVPWQLWVVSTLLALEGVSANLPMAFSKPVAALWLAAKIVTITGFFLRWRPVYIYFLLVGSLHVLAFAVAAPVVAFLNLVMVALVASTHRYFFPHSRNA